MKTSDFEKQLVFSNVKGSYLKAENENAKQYLLSLRNGEIIALKDATKRDISFHRCYFAFVSSVYDNLPTEFQEVCPKKYFYKYLKGISQQTKEIEIFGTIIHQEPSISFGRMNEIKFRQFVSEQMTFIYNELFMVWYDEELANVTIDVVQNDFENFIKKLI